MSNSTKGKLIIKKRTQYAVFNKPVYCVRFVFFECSNSPIYNP